MKRSVLAILVSLLWVACNKEDDPKTRSFYMGFTPFPYEMSLNAVNETYARIEMEADIINHHFDNGVPWEQALNEQPFHQAIIDDWNYRKSKTSINHKVYVSVTPLNALRTGLASVRGAEENMPLLAPWDTYPFNHVNVRTAYFNYCKRLIDFFKPDYFNMAIEANLLYVNSPDKWSTYLQLHQYVFAQLKLTYPDLPIFSSVSIAYLLPGYIEGNDFVQQRLAALQVLDYSDMYGISFYPYLSSYLGNPYPETTFDAIFPLSQKPIAITETGYPAQTFTLDVGSGPVTIESDPVKQKKYFEDLLAACERYHARFVINFTIRDYDQLWVQSGSPTGLGIMWRDTGFYDENGQPRPVQNTWKNYLARKHKEPAI